MTAPAARAGADGSAAPVAPSDALRWWLAGLFGLWFLALAWEPSDRKTWLLENLLSFPLAIWLIASWPRVALTRTSYLLLFGFLALHEIGSHYTYSLVPLPDWLRLGEGRNHYDRAIHFAFGLVFTRPIAELLSRAVHHTSKRLVVSLSVAVILALSTCYELLEWGAAVITDPEQGIAFVGAQGDIWDAQKDSGLALLGALLCAAWLFATSGWTADHWPTPSKEKNAP